MHSVVKDLMWLCAKQIYVCCRKENITKELALANTTYTILFQRGRKHTHPRPLLLLSRLYPWRKNVQQLLQMAKPGWTVCPAAVPGKTQLLYSSSATMLKQYQANPQKEQREREGDNSVRLLFVVTWSSMRQVQGGTEYNLSLETHSRTVHHCYTGVGKLQEDARALRKLVSPCEVIFKQTMDSC